MQKLYETFRIWWKNPAKISEREKDREVTHLELFYDLVYVAIVIELTHILAGHISGEILLQYIALFAMIWWAWLNGSLYHELHGNNDIRTRIFTFMQMIALAGMGIFIHNAFGTGYQGFATSYTLFLSILTFLWWRTGVHDPMHRIFSTPYVWGFSFTTLLFFCSIFTQASTSYYLWGIAIIFSLFLPFILNQRHKSISLDKKKLQHREASLVIYPSFGERLGLLTIIILGEVVISTVQGSSKTEVIDSDIILSVVGIFGIIISLWWIYFDFIAKRLPVQTNVKRFTWIYLHLFLTMSIGLFSVGVLNTLVYSESLVGVDRWIFIAPLMIFLFTTILLIHTLDIRVIMKKYYRSGMFASLISIILLGVLGMIDMSTTLTILCAMFILSLPVLFGFIVWVNRASRIINITKK